MTFVPTKLSEHFNSSDRTINGGDKETLGRLLAYVLAHGCTRIVDPTIAAGSREGHATIQAALDAAEAGDSIWIKPGTYAENILLTSWDTADKNDIRVFARPGSVHIAPASGKALEVAGAVVGPVNLYLHGIIIDGFAGSAPIDNTPSSGAFNLHLDHECVVNGNTAATGVAGAVGSVSKIFTREAVFQTPPTVGIVGDTEAQSQAGGAASVYARIVDPGAASGSGSYATIQAALDAAATGDVIFVKPGTYDENLVLDALAKSLTIIATPGTVAIAPAAGKVLDITGAITGEKNLRFYGITFTGVAASIPIDNTPTSGECRIHLDADCLVTGDTACVGVAGANTSKIVSRGAKFETRPTTGFEGYVDAQARAGRAYDLIVDPSAGNVEYGVYRTLQAALDAAGVGTKIGVMPGTYVENVVLDAWLAAAKDNVRLVSIVPLAAELAPSSGVGIDVTGTCDGFNLFIEDFLISGFAGSKPIDNTPGAGTPTIHLHRTKITGNTACDGAAGAYKCRSAEVVTAFATGVATGSVFVGEDLYVTGGVVGDLDP